MDLIRSMHLRQIGGGPNHRQMRANRTIKNLDFALSEYRVAADYNFEIDYDKGPPLACHLHPKGRYLGVSTECGNVIVVDSVRLQARDDIHNNILGDDRSKYRMSTCFEWMAHNNAIFDIQWLSDTHSELKLITAAGDQSLALWDLEDLGGPISQVPGAHKSSIRSVSVCKVDSERNTFATGARDGAIKLWDIRCLNGGSVGTIEDAHLRMNINSASKTRRSSSKASIYPPRSDPSSSVSFVLFDSYDKNRLYSSGANDGCVKMWDIRCIRNKPPKQGSKVASKVFPYIGATSSSNFHGYSSLAQNRDLLFACCSDGVIYGYSLGVEDETKLEPNSILRFNGHQVNNYTKINTISDSYLISGSTDGRAYIWSFDFNSSRYRSTEGNNNSNQIKIYKPMVYLPHGTDEVSVVEVEPATGAIFTCSDDNRIAKWSLGRDPWCISSKLQASNNSQMIYSRDSDKNVRPLDGSVSKEWEGISVEHLAIIPKTPIGNLKPKSSIPRNSVDLLSWARSTQSPHLDSGISRKSSPMTTPRSHSSTLRQISHESEDKSSPRKSLKRPLQESVTHSPSKLNSLASQSSERPEAKRFMAETPSPSDISKGKWKLKTLKEKTNNRRHMMTACRKIETFFQAVSPSPTSTSISSS